MSVQCFTWWGMTGVKSLLDAQQNLRAEQRCAGDDLIGPRDIKRGVHLLTNAEMALLIEDAEAEEEPTARGRRKRRDSATLRGDKLTEEQITQVSLLTSSTGACTVTAAGPPLMQMLSHICWRDCIMQAYG